MNDDNIIEAVENKVEKKDEKMKQEIENLMDSNQLHDVEEVYDNETDKVFYKIINSYTLESVMEVNYKLLLNILEDKEKDSEPCFGVMNKDLSEIIQLDEEIVIDDDHTVEGDIEFNSEARQFLVANTI